MLRSRGLRWPVLAAVGVVLVGSGTAVALVGGGDVPSYRTATAARGDVEQTLSLTGLVDAARRSDLSFGTAGTVASVRVAQGETVRTGQVVAVLDTEGLDAAVTAAKAALATAKAQLESDQEAQTASVAEAVPDSGLPTGQPTTDQPTTGQPTTGQDVTAALLAELAAEQRAVLAAQSEASAAIATAGTALATQTAVCADAYGAASSADPEETDGSTAQVDTEEVDPDAACDTALAAVQQAQAAVKAAQDELADALTALGATLTSALGTVTGAQPTGAPARAAAAADQGTDGATSPIDENEQPGGGTTVTAAQLASDQAQIDQARADLLSAEATRNQAVLRSTRSGTVASLDLAVGDQVTSGAAVAVVVGGSAVTLSGTVAEGSVDQVRVGQTARVSVPGSTSTTTGTVTAIGLTADTSSGSTLYPVTITVDDPEIALPTGSRAQVAIVLATSEDVVTLPISAVSQDGANVVVRTWDGSTLTRTPVTLGAVGARTVAVTEGIDEGDEVVLADADAEISGASSELNQRGGFGPPAGGNITFRSGGPGGGAPTVGRAN